MVFCAGKAQGRTPVPRLAVERKQTLEGLKSGHFDAHCANLQRPWALNSGYYVCYYDCHYHLDEEVFVVRLGVELLADLVRVGLGVGP